MAAQVTSSVIYDDIDREIVRDRMFLMNSSLLPNVGEFVLCRSGKFKRISYVIGNQAVYVIDGGCFYLGLGFSCETSDLCVGTGILQSKLVLTDNMMPGDMYIFHHDNCRGPEGSVYFVVYLRVWKEE